MRPIRVLIVDDHALVREGLTRLVSGFSGMEVVGTAPDGESAVILTRTVRPDVVLLDLSMAGLDGLAAIPQLLQASVDVHVLAVSMHDEPEYAEAAMKRGACGLVSKTASTEALDAAIRAVAAGRSLPVRVGLTPREEEVLSLLGQGRENPEIVALLGIRPKTLDHHCERLMAKLGIHTRAGLIAHAKRIAPVPGSD